MRFSVCIPDYSGNSDALFEAYFDSDLTESITCRDDYMLSQIFEDKYGSVIDHGGAYDDAGNIISDECCFAEIEDTHGLKKGKKIVLELCTAVRDQYAPGATILTK